MFFLFSHSTLHSPLLSFPLFRCLLKFLFICGADLITDWLSDCQHRHLLMGHYLDNWLSAACYCCCRPNYIWINDNVYTAGLRDDRCVCRTIDWLIMTLNWKKLHKLQLKFQFVKPCGIWGIPHKSHTCNVLMDGTRNFNEQIARFN